jgi:hypothetical protein
MRYVELDEINLQILKERQDEYLNRHPMVPREGDYVDFACGTVRRISEDYGDEVQTSSIDPNCIHSGSFYLGKDYLSFSGGLFRSIPVKSLTKSPELRPGGVWFFNHDEVCAHNGIYATLQCFVWKCNLPANT